jgi:hypothetical protein
VCQGRGKPLDAWELSTRLPQPGSEWVVHLSILPSSPSDLEQLEAMSVQPLPMYPQVLTPVQPVPSSVVGTSNMKLFKS